MTSTKRLLVTVLLVALAFFAVFATTTKCFSQNGAWEKVDPSDYGSLVPGVDPSGILSMRIRDYNGIEKEPAAFPQTDSSELPMSVKRAAKNTCKVICRSKEFGDLGSGCLINSGTEDQYVLTCGHVFRDARTLNLPHKLICEFWNGETVEAKYVFGEIPPKGRGSGGHPDWAIIKLLKKVSLPGATVARSNRKMFYGGYPEGKDRFRISSSNTGRGAAELDGFAISGQSGGPVFNQDGLLAGCIIATSAMPEIDNVIVYTPISQILQKTRTSQRINKGWKTATPEEPFPEIALAAPAIPTPAIPTPAIPIPQPSQFETAPGQLNGPIVGFQQPTAGSGTRISPCPTCPPTVVQQARPAPYPQQNYYAQPQVARPQAVPGYSQPRWNPQFFHPPPAAFPRRKLKRDTDPRLKALEQQIQQMKLLMQDSKSAPPKPPIIAAPPTPPILSKLTPEKILAPPAPSIDKAWMRGVDDSISGLKKMGDSLSNKLAGIQMPDLSKYARLDQIPAMPDMSSFVNNEQLASFADQTQQGFSALSQSHEDLNANHSRLEFLIGGVKKAAAAGTAVASHARWLEPLALSGPLGIGLGLLGWFSRKKKLSTEIAPAALAPPAGPEYRSPPRGGLEIVEPRRIEYRQAPQVIHQPVVHQPVVHQPVHQPVMMAQPVMHQPVVHQPVALPAPEPKRFERPRQDRIIKTIPRKKKTTTVTEEHEHHEVHPDDQHLVGVHHDERHLD